MMRPQVENSWYCVFALLTMIITGTFSIGYGLASLNTVVSSLRRTYSEIFQTRYGVALPDESWTLLLSLTMSVVFIGGLFGSILSNIMLNRLTRKQVFITSNVSNIIGRTMTAVGAKAVHSYELMIAGRFVTGISVGSLMALIPIIVNEVSVAHRRLFYGALFGTLMPAGGFSGTFIGWQRILGSYDTYYGVIIFGMLFPVIYLSIAYWITDTPFQFMLKYGSTEAYQIFRRLRVGSEEAIKEEFESLRMKNDVELHEKEKIKEASFKEIIKTRQYRKHFFGVLIISCYIGASGLGNVLSFSNKIFVDAGLQNEAVTPATMGTFGLGVVFSVIAIFAMKRFDPRTLILFNSVVMTLSHVLMVASLQTYRQVPAMSLVSVAAMWIFMASFSVVNTAGFAVLGVLCIDRTRHLCINIGAAGFWFFAWLAVFITPYLSVWIQGYGFLLWVGVIIISMVYFYFCLPNTAGRTEEEIQSFYKD